MSIRIIKFPLFVQDSDIYNLAICSFCDKEIIWQILITIIYSKWQYLA